MILKTLGFNASLKIVPFEPGLSPTNSSLSKYLTFEMVKIISHTMLVQFNSDSFTELSHCKYFKLAIFLEIIQ